MSSLLQSVARFFAGLNARHAPLDTDTMSLRDWADLPIHHPKRDNAPC